MVIRMRQRHLIILAKAPRLGRVKRRLARDIGDLEALNFYRTTLTRTIRRLSRDRRWQTWLFVDNNSARWPGGLPRRQQTQGDLGRRMEKALQSVPSGPVVLIGSDIPCANASDIRAAFHALEGMDAVFGPSTDGGYWLIGIPNNRAAPTLFQDVRWSSEHALSDTIHNLRLPRKFGLAPVLSDIDNGISFANWRLESGH